VAERIYLIDDEPDMTTLAERLFTLKGFVVCVNNDPSAGLSHLIDTDYDLIFIDLMMPGMNGFDLLDSLRKTPRHASTPIIILSAKRLNDAERKRLLLNNARFLLKPLSPRQMFEAVQDTLRLQN